jgi:chromate transport protein ChrA
MVRQRALQVIVGLLGVLFVTSIFPIVMSLRHYHSADAGDDMMLSLYFTLGIFLLMAVRNPAAHRSLIAFTAWSSFAHAAVMGVLAMKLPSERSGLLIAVGVLGVIGLVLIGLRPRAESKEKAVAARA